MTSDLCTARENSSRGRVLRLSENHELAAHLWKDGVDHDRWDADKPWKYLTFLTDIEEIEVDIEEFNELIGYDETYRPQGFTRVSDNRLDRLKDEYESVETALAELTEAGEKVHHVDDTDDEQTTDLASRLETASTNGDDPDEFENSSRRRSLDWGVRPTGSKAAVTPMSRSKRHVISSSRLKLEAVESSIRSKLPTSINTDVSVGLTTRSSSHPGSPRR